MAFHPFAHLRRRMAMVGTVVVMASGGVGLSSATASASVPDVGQLRVIAGTGGSGPATPGPASNSMLDEPFGVALDGSGNLYVADALNHQVDRVSPAGTLTVFAGTGHQGTTVPGPATRSPLYYPDGVAVSRTGAVFIADAGNHVIDKVSPGGTLSVVAGTGSPGPSTAGPATRSDLNYPYGLAIDASGDVFIADTFNNEVDEVSPGGTLSVVAGTGSPGGVTPGPAVRSERDHPTGVAMAANGSLYVSDTFTSQIVKVSRAGVLSVVAGTGRGGRPTPGPATRSDLEYCYAVAVDATGNVYIADTFNHVVEKVSPSGVLSVIAGTGAPGTPTVGPATQRNLGEPDGVVVDGSGDVYISDYATSEVVEVVAPVLGIAAPSHGGYVEVTAAGGVVARGTAFHGSALPPRGVLASPVAGIAAVPDGGYLLATAAGNVYAYGTALHGSPHASHLHLGSPVTGIAAVPGGGYLLVTTGGAIYHYGTAFHGSPAGHHTHLASPVTGIAATAGGGYLVVTGGGRVYAFGTPLRGSPAATGVTLTAPVVGIAATSHGGYDVATADGTVYRY